jgi:hypothetical protein
MIEGSGSVSLTSGFGSGSGRPKNTWIYGSGSVTLWGSFKYINQVVPDHVWHGVGICLGLDQYIRGTPCHPISSADVNMYLKDYLIVLFIGPVHMHICRIQVLIQYVATRQIRIRTIHANPDPGFVFTLKVHLNHISCLSIT